MFDKVCNTPHRQLVIYHICKQKVFLNLAIFTSSSFFLTLSCRRSLSYRNQSIDMWSKSVDWFLYDNGLRHERVNKNTEEQLLGTGERMCEVDRRKSCGNWCRRCYLKNIWFISRRWNWYRQYSCLNEKILSPSLAGNKSCTIFLLHFQSY